MYAIYKRIKEQRLPFFIGLIVVVVILGYFPFRIEFEEDISKFIPRNSQNSQLQDILKSVNFDDKIILNLTTIEDGTIDDLTDFADEFINTFKSDAINKDIRIQGFINDEEAVEMLDLAYDYAPFLLTSKDYDSLEKRLHQQSIEKQTASNYRSLISPSGMMSKSYILKDPFQIASLALQNLNPNDSDGIFELKNNYLVTKDHQNLLLFISSPNNIDTNFLVRELYGTIDTIGQKHDKSVRPSLFGGPIIAYANATQIKDDIIISLGIASLLLIVLFVIFYRNIFTPILLVLPTLLGGLVGISVLLIIRENISAVSLGIGSILLGVTFDYSLHVLTHLRNGASVKQLYKSISKPILMSSATTALAFLSIVIIDSQALQDLGIFAASSVLFASISALFLIPLVYRPNQEASIKNVKNESANNQVLDRIGAYHFHKNRLLVLLILGLCILSAFTYNKVEFNNNLSDLNYFPEELRNIEKKLDTLIDSKSKSIYVATYDAHLEAALEKNDSLYTVLRSLKDNGDIESINSLSRYLPAKNSQEETLKYWQRFWSKERIENMKSNLIVSGSVYGFKEDAFIEFYNYLDKPFNYLTEANYDSITNINMDDYIGHGDNLIVLSTLIKVERDEITTITNSLSKINNSVIIDRQSLNESMISNLKTEFNQLLMYCIIAVFGFLLLVYRNIKLSLITFLPILFTWGITIGIMGLIGLQFNIFNIIISSFVFGLGVDYSIFITNGLYAKSKNDSHVFSTTKTSILLSVLTTVIGIGALFFARHPALQSIAIISIIGIVTAVLIAFTIQPILYNILMKKIVWEK